MRYRFVPCLALLAIIATAPQAALAAPTCQTLSGDARKCGAPDAMPVSWQPSPQQLLERERARPIQTNGNAPLLALGALAAFLAMVALMPDFDGRRGRDWGKQEGDEEGRE